MDSNDTLSQKKLWQGFSFGNFRNISWTIYSKKEKAVSSLYLMNCFMFYLENLSFMKYHGHFHVHFYAILSVPRFISDLRTAYRFSCLPPLSPAMITKNGQSTADSKPRKCTRYTVSRKCGSMQCTVQVNRMLSALGIKTCSALSRKQNVLSPCHNNMQCTKSKEQNDGASLCQRSKRWNVKKTENPEYVKFSGE